MVDVDFELDLSEIDNVLQATGAATPAAEKPGKSNDYASMFSDKSSEVPIHHDDFAAMFSQNPIAA